MRIQETDQILKEARYARNAANQPKRGFFSRLWHSLTSIFH